MDQAETMQQRIKGFFPDLLGIRFVEATPDRVLAELDVRDDLCTVPGILHGGAMMAFADTLGAVATVLTIPANARTTTLESKTNFFGPGRGGTTISAETLPLHRGKRTMVWQTSIRSPEGKLLAQVTQTQYVDSPS
ncbi:PaaI family thioesterase [bacterium]|nr:PaaI family thioesterase [bacterium]